MSISDMHISCPAHNVTAVAVDPVFSSMPLAALAEMVNSVSPCCHMVWQLYGEINAGLLATSSILSAVGDIGILSFAMFSEEAHRLLTTRLVAYLAAADLVGESPVLGSMKLPGPPVSTWGGPWCALQGAGNWFAQLSTWLWTMACAPLDVEPINTLCAPLTAACFLVVMADAHAVSAGVHSPVLVPRGVVHCRSEWQYHVICWGLPAAVVGVSLVFGGVFGTSDDGSSECTVCRSDVAMCFYAVLWVALLYNALVFFSVHRAMRRVLVAHAAVLEPSAQLEMRNRVDALGNRTCISRTLPAPCMLTQRSPIQCEYTTPRPQGSCSTC